MENNESILVLVRRRLEDDKSLVRKAALQTMEILIPSLQVQLTTEDIDALKSRCFDSALSVRKQALSTVTGALLTHAQNAAMQKAWLEAVMPLIMDSEDSIRTKCLELLDSIFLEALSNTSTSAARQTLAWELLQCMDEKQDMVRWHLA